MLNKPGLFCASPSKGYVFKYMEWLFPLPQRKGSKGGRRRRLLFGPERPKSNPVRILHSQSGMNGLCLGTEEVLDHNAAFPQTADANDQRCFRLCAPYPLRHQPLGQQHSTTRTLNTAALLSTFQPATVLCWTGLDRTGPVPVDDLSTVDYPFCKKSLDSLRCANDERPTTKQGRWTRFNSRGG